MRKREDTKVVGKRCVVQKVLVREEFKLSGGDHKTFSPGGRSRRKVQ